MDRIADIVDVSRAKIQHVALGKAEKLDWTEYSKLVKYVSIATKEDWEPFELFSEVGSSGDQI